MDKAEMFRNPENYDLYEREKRRSVNDYFDELYNNSGSPLDYEYRSNLEGVRGVKLCKPQKDVTPNYAYFPVVFDGYRATRDEIFEALSEQGITARKYFYPLTNSFECYKDLPTAGTDKTPIAKYLADRVLTLPLYADLALEDVDRICEIILK